MPSTSTKAALVRCVKVRDTKQYTRYEVVPGQGYIGTLYVPLSPANKDEIKVAVPK